LNLLALLKAQIVHVLRRGARHDLSGIGELIQSCCHHNL